MVRGPPREIRRARALRLRGGRAVRRRANPRARGSVAAPERRRRPATRSASLRVFTGRPHDNIVQSYGAEFAEALEGSPRRRVARAREQRRAARSFGSCRSPRRSPPTSRRCAASSCRTGRTPRWPSNAAPPCARSRRSTPSESRPRAVSRVLRASCSWRSLRCWRASAAAHEMTHGRDGAARDARLASSLWQWTRSGNRAPGEGLTAMWPDGCAADANAAALRRRRPERHARDRRRRRACTRRRSSRFTGSTGRATSTR